MSKTLFALMLISAMATSACAQSPEVIRANQIIQDSLKAYQSIQSYETQFYRRYPLKPKKDARIFLRYEKPQNIYMSWEEGSQRGLQLFHARGEYDDKLLCRPPGFFFNFIPIVHLDKDDPRVMKEERRGIDQAGIGYFIEDLASEFGQTMRDEKVTVTDIIPVRIDGQHATQLTLNYDVPEWEFKKKVISFSDGNKLPVHIELYADNGDLVEVYDYFNIQINPDRQSPDFQSSIDRRLWDLYDKV